MATTRERIIAESESVFDRQGFAATGMDRLTEAAGVSSRTLYKHVGSKTGLIAAVLDARRTRFLRIFDVSSVDELFAALGDWVRDEGSRGCLFLRALGEGGASIPEIADPVRQYREQLRELIGRLVPESAAGEHERLTDQIVVLFEGATSAASYLGDRAITAARAAAGALIAAEPACGAAQKGTST